MFTPYSGRVITRSNKYTCIVSFAGYISSKISSEVQIILRDPVYGTVIKVTPAWNQQYKLTGSKHSMRSTYLHETVILKLKNVDNDCENIILYFPFSFLNSVGFYFITQYAFYSKLKFERDSLWFYVNEILSVAYKFVLTIKTMMTNCIFKTATQYYNCPV